MGKRGRGGGKRESRGVKDGEPPGVQVSTVECRGWRGGEGRREQPSKLHTCTLLMSLVNTPDARPYSVQLALLRAPSMSLLCR